MAEEEADKYFDLLSEPIQGVKDLDVIDAIRLMAHHWGVYARRDCDQKYTVAEIKAIETAVTLATDKLLALMTDGGEASDAPISEPYIPEPQRFVCCLCGAKVSGGKKLWCHNREWHVGSDCYASLQPLNNGVKEIRFKHAVVSKREGIVHIDFIRP